MGDIKVPAGGRKAVVHSKESAKPSASRDVKVKEKTVDCDEGRMSAQKLRDMDPRCLDGLKHPYMTPKQRALGFMEYKDRMNTAPDLKSLLKVCDAAQTDLGFLVRRGSGETSIFLSIYPNVERILKQDEDAFKAGKPVANSAADYQSIEKRFPDVVRPIGNARPDLTDRVKNMIARLP